MTSRCHRHLGLEDFEEEHSPHLDHEHFRVAVQDTHHLRTESTPKRMWGAFPVRIARGKQAMMVPSTGQDTSSGTGGGGGEAGKGKGRGGEGQGGKEGGERGESQGPHDVYT